MCFVIMMWFDFLVKGINVHRHFFISLRWLKVMVIRAMSLPTMRRWMLVKWRANGPVPWKSLKWCPAIGPATSQTSHPSGPSSGPIWWLTTRWSDVIEEVVDGRKLWIFCKSWVQEDLRPDVISFNATMSTCKIASHWQKGLDLLHVMSHFALSPNATSYIVIWSHVRRPVNGWRCWVCLKICWNQRFVQMS